MFLRDLYWNEIHRPH